MQKGEQVRKIAGIPIPEKVETFSIAKQKLKILSYIFSMLVDSVHIETAIFSPEANVISEEFVLVDAPGFADCGVTRKDWGLLTDWQSKRNRFLIGARATYEFDILLLCVNGSQLGAQATGDLVNLQETLRKYEEDLSKVNNWLEKRVIIVFTLLDLAVDKLIWRPVDNIHSLSTTQKVQEILKIPRTQQSHLVELPNVPFLAFQTPHYLIQTRKNLNPEMVAQKEGELTDFWGEFEKEMVSSIEVESSFVRKLVDSLKTLFLKESESTHSTAFFQILNDMVDRKGLEAARSRFFGGKWEFTKKILSNLRNIPFDEIRVQLHKVSDPVYMAQNMESAVEKSRVWTIQKKEDHFVSAKELKKYWKQVFQSRIPLDKLERYEKLLHVVSEAAQKLNTILMDLS